MMTELCIRLNETTAELDAVLPPTDSRRRRCLRALEEGLYQEVRSRPTSASVGVEHAFCTGLLLFVTAYTCAQAMHACLRDGTGLMLKSQPLFLFPYLRSQKPT